MRINQLKRKLLAGEAAFGVSVMIPSPQIVDMVGRLGFDWVLIDCEHGTISCESVELMVMAAEATGITPIARPATNRPEAIMQVLDRGAQGVQVPHVSNAQIAETAVAAATFFPMGSRSLAAGTRPANYGYGLQMEEYVQRANAETLICVQIEDADALRNLDQILAVRGIDVFFVGPSDLSQSLQRPGQADSPDLKAAMDQVFRSVGQAGKVAGCAGNAQKCSGYLEQGVQYMYTHLTSLLSAGSLQFLDAVPTRTVSDSHGGGGSK